MKMPEGKYQPHLLYKSMKIEVARVREFGKNKHGGEETWMTTTPMEHLDAAQRHIDECIEAIRVEDDARLVDPESGLSHLAHAICNLMFEIERRSRE